MQAGFATTHITPPLGTHKVGWLKDIVPDRIVDPLAARIAIFDDGACPIAFVGLDTLSIRWTDTQTIRRRISETHGFPGEQVMVAASHNHGGPAIASIGDVPRDDAYVASLVDKVVEAFGAALANRREAELAFGSVRNYEQSSNRRTVWRDGTTRTFGDLRSPDALYIEGPIDPEVAVIAAREPGGALFGMLVNYACHPVHLGGDPVFTCGWPGILCQSLMQRHHLDAAVFINGACADIIDGRRLDGFSQDHRAMGEGLADYVDRALEALEWSADWPLSATRASVDLPYRDASPEEVAGTIRGAQRFIDSAIYDRGMPRLLERIRTRQVQPAEVQCLGIGEQLRIVSVPCEYFVKLGLRIKRRAWPRRALIASCANGMVGYVPTREAFEGGGYETTFAASSRQAPEAGDILADAALRLISGAS